MNALSADLEPIAKLSRDLRSASVTLSHGEARFLVDAYYIMQEDRKRSCNQERALGDAGEPHDVITWYAAQNRTLENQLKRALDAYSDSQPLGQWARSIIGIGPVIAAGLLAHIDMHKAPSAANIWSFAGLDPKTTWEKGKKRPFNASLKTLCWKIGESFVKVSGNPDSTYARIYRERKDWEIAQNDSGSFADQAANALERKKIGKSTEAFKHYSSGKLPPAHVHARAKRYAVKLFLSHYHEMGCRLVLDVQPPRPWVIEHGGHVHMIPASEAK